MRIMWDALIDCESWELSDIITGKRVVFDVEYVTLVNIGVVHMICEHDEGSLKVIDISVHFSSILSRV